MKKTRTWWPWLAVGIAALYLSWQAVQLGDRAGAFHWQEFGTLPVQESGRILPFDTLARVRIMHISHRSMGFTHEIRQKDPVHPDKEIVTDSYFVTPSQWAGEVLFSKFSEKKPAFDYRVFRIDNDQVVDSLGLPMRPGSRRYSLLEFAMNKDFWNQLDRIQEKESSGTTDLYDQKLVELFGQFKTFDSIMKFNVRLVPPSGRRDDDGETHWLTLIGAAQESKEGIEHRAFDFFDGMIQAYAADQPEKFNKTLADYQKYLERTRPSEYRSARVEAFFNHFAPFYHCAVIYGLIFVLGVFSWTNLDWSRTLQSTAFALALLTFAVHTWALITRIYLTGRPPVTNLYSSAVFIGWGCVGLCLFLEWIFRNGIGIVVAASSGMLTLIVAHNLVTGDTMEMLQAVLDTNFWLATHVICITFGYTATFVAGFLGILYVLRGVFTTQLRGEVGANLVKMIYGVTCFAVFLSFVGTVLGGIWADESWGRFWGWDPKENGALLIVIWNALVLHARWGGIVKARGLANLVIFGNCVTAWSWFGTNMLGVGLHSYGRMDSAMFWLLVFVFTQLGLIGIGCTPLPSWKSFGAPAPPKNDATPPPSASARATVAAST